MFEILLLISFFVTITFFLTRAWVKAVCLNTLDAIETNAPMFGSTKEVEAIYISFILYLLRLNLFKWFIIKQRIEWYDWFRFLEKEYNVPHNSIPYYHSHPIVSHSELVEKLKKFREECGL